MAQPTKAEIEATYSWLLAEKGWQATQLAKQVVDVTAERDRLAKVFQAPRPYIG